MYYYFLCAREHTCACVVSLLQHTSEQFFNDVTSVELYSKVLRSVVRTTKEVADFPVNRF